MRENLVTTSNRNVDEVRKVNRGMIEKALQMRCLSYLAQVKAQLLTETIFEVDSSKKHLLKSNQDLALKADTIEKQRRVLKQKLAELSQVKEELQVKNLELEAKNAELEHLNKLVIQRTTKLEKTQRALSFTLVDVNQINQELENSNLKLLELDKLKSMFIASMSHELRTPLNAIIGFSSLILNGMTGEINEEQRDQLGRVHRSGKHLLSLITDVIDISKLESGKIHPHVNDFLLGGVIEEACDSLKLQLEEKNLLLVKRCPEVPISLHSDRKRLLQCLLNYLSNAVKFTQAGTIELSVESNTETVTISVADSGIGISSEDLPRLFKSFVRLDSPLKTTTPGTGLGLYLTKKLATEVLGGEVWVESTPGEGSKFYLKIPKGLAGAKSTDH